MADNTIINPGSGGDAIATDDIGGVKFQRVKVTHGADGSATDVSSASPLPVDTELPAAAALADGASNPTTPLLGSVPLLWNNATLDRQRGNTEGTLLASAARTAVATSPTQTNYNARGVHLVLAVASAGTGTLVIQLTGNYAGGAAYVIENSGYVTGTGNWVFEVYPGASTAATGGAYGTVTRKAASLPRSWYGQVNPSDSSSWTYTLYAALIV